MNDGHTLQRQQHCPKAGERQFSLHCSPAHCSSLPTTHTGSRRSPSRSFCSLGRYPASDRPLPIYRGQCKHVHRPRHLRTGSLPLPPPLAAAHCTPPPRLAPQRAHPPAMASLYATSKTWRKIVDATRQNKGYMLAFAATCIGVPLLFGDQVRLARSWAPFLHSFSPSSCLGLPSCAGGLRREPRPCLIEPCSGLRSLQPRSPTLAIHMCIKPPPRCASRSCRPPARWPRGRRASWRRSCARAAASRRRRGGGRAGGAAPGEACGRPASSWSALPQRTRQADAS